MVKRWEIVQTQVTFVLLLIKKKQQQQQQEQTAKKWFLNKNFDGRKHYTIFFSLLKVSVQTNARKMLIREVFFTGITKMEIIRVVAH